MILIIGGAYMGKLTYAKRELGVSDGEVFDLSSGLPPAPFAVLTHLESFTKSRTESGEDPEQMLAALEPCLGCAAVISREVGCGVVPMDPLERKFRENHGRVLAMLAERSEHIIRLFCGIAEVLK